MSGAYAGKRQPRVVPGVARVAGKRQGLTAEQVERAILRQGGKCALCMKPLGVSFAVDHDHWVAENVCGHDPSRGCPKCFRGIVCHRDNSILGWGHDDPDFFERLAQYIRLSRAGILHS
jgi:hypothetical protein